MITEDIVMNINKLITIMIIKIIKIIILIKTFIIQEEIMLIKEEEVDQETRTQLITINMKRKKNINLFRTFKLRQQRNKIAMKI